MQFQGTRMATVENMDTAIDRVFVHVVSSGRIRPATRVIQKCLKEHLLETRCTIIVDAR